MRSSLFTSVLMLVASCTPNDLFAARVRDAPDGTIDAPDLCATTDCAEDEDCVQGQCLPMYPATSFSFHTTALCFVGNDRALRCFGANHNGRLGLGDTEPRTEPTRVGEAMDWIEVTSAIGEHACGLRDGGRLFCWGANGRGNLGLGDTDDRWIPTELRLEQWPWLSSHAGSGHSCARDRERALYCWGRNEDGELATGDTGDRNLPVRVEGLAPSRVAVGWGHTCTLATSGRIHCWGRNYEGQLGLGDRVSRMAPERVGSDDDWQDVRSQGVHTCALKFDGSLYCWGSNQDGQLGVEDARDRLAPTHVAPGTLWSTVSPGLYRTCGIQRDGSLHCWGALSHDLIAVPDPNDALTPVRIGTETDWVDVRTGYGDVCALRRDGMLACWGRELDGTLGLGDTDPRVDPPRWIDTRAL